MSTRRTAPQIASDRRDLLAYFREAEGYTYGVKAPEWAKASDLAALVADGSITKTVKKEYDYVSNRSGKFGGVNACVRKRAYYQHWSEPTAEVEAAKANHPTAREVEPEVTVETIAQLNTAISNVVAENAPFEAPFNDRLYLALTSLLMLWEERAAQLNSDDYAQHFLTDSDVLDAADTWTISPVDHEGCYIDGPMIHDYEELRDTLFANLYDDSES